MGGETLRCYHVATTSRYPGRKTGHDRLPQSVVFCKDRWGWLLLVILRIRFVISRSSVQVRAPAPAFSRLVGFSIQKHDATSVHSAAVVRANSPLSAVVSRANGHAAKFRRLRGAGNVFTRRKRLVAGSYRPHRFGLGGEGSLCDGNGEGRTTIMFTRVRPG